jgi:hypothetical protein
MGAMIFPALYSSFGLALFLLVILGGSHWLGLSPADLLDWAIGIASFVWLLVIVTVPWNIYFEAKTTIAEAQQSQQIDIAIDEAQLNGVRRIAQRSLWIVLILHGLSAVAFYGLAASGFSDIGYFGAIAALCLTVLRPAVRTYQYFAMQLRLVRQQFKYPREDVVELRSRLDQLIEKVTDLEQRLDLDDPRSWISVQQRQWDALRDDLTVLAVNQEEIKIKNQAEHERLSREAQQAIAQLTIDGQFLDHVREIIRFFKTT